MNEEIPKITFRKGKRVTLRLIDENDAETLVMWINDPEVTKFLGSSKPTSFEEEKKWVEDVNGKKDRLSFMIEVEGTPIGNISIFEIDHIHRTATTGTMIGDKGYWGKGYGTEAKMLLLDYAFNVLNLRKIKSEVFVFNERSVAYAKKCGYVEEGTLKKERYYNGKYWDLVLLAVYRDAWLPLWEKFIED